MANRGNDGFKFVKLDDKSFDICGSTGETYGNFIESFNSNYFGALLVNSIDASRSRPFLLKQEDNSFRYFDIELQASEEGLEALVKKVKFRFNASNLYLFGFHIDGDQMKNGKELWYQLQDYGHKKVGKLLGMTNLFPPVHAAYTELPDRKKQRLGKQILRRAVVNLSTYKNGIKGTNISRDILVVIQMFAEAMRFERIREHLSYHYKEERVLDSSHITLQNNWEDLCKKFFAHCLAERNFPGFRMKNEYDELEVSIVFESDCKMFEYTTLGNGRFEVTDTPECKKHLRRLVPEYAELARAKAESPEALALLLNQYAEHRR